MKTGDLYEVRALGCHEARGQLYSREIWERHRTAEMLRLSEEMLVELTLAYGCNKGISCSTLQTRMNVND